MTSPAFSTTYHYLYTAENGGPNHYTGLVSMLDLTPAASGSNLDAFKLGYTYDNVGNITYIKEYAANNTQLSSVHYQYDAQNQLTYESSTAIGTWNYGYDTFGNIRSKSHSRNNNVDESWADTYSTGVWKDKLTGLSITRITNSGSTAVSGSYTYDDSGNPTGCFNPGDASTWTMTWKNGRELSKAQKSGLTVKYDYDVNGLRTYNYAVAAQGTVVRLTPNPPTREGFSPPGDRVLLAEKQLHFLLFMFVPVNMQPRATVIC